MPQYVTQPIRFPAEPSIAVVQPQETAFENAERIARFQGLASADSDARPLVQQLYADAGVDPLIAGPVPVVQVVFPEQVFFDTASDIPRPESLPVLSMIAQNIREDAPGTQVTVLGHTDAVGGDDYNMALSERRATSVLHALVDRGVNAGQLSAVAIGKRQPIASNATPDGRAHNRRVEFLISPSEAANLAVIRQRPVDPAFLSPNYGVIPDPPVVSALQVFRARAADGGLVIEPSQLLSLNYLPSKPAAPAASMRATAAPTPRAPAPEPQYVPNIPKTYHKQDLGPPQTF